MKITRQVFLVALATSFTLPTIAEEQSPIIVTATRTAQTVDESLASVTVITKEQIEQQQANDLYELLASIAGIDMINAGGSGKDTSLYMRGTNTGHVQVLIDGVQVGSATLGQASYQHIPIEMIERIEIVRGSRASLYGSEAIGGVIQIFTNKSGKENNLTFSSSIGSYETKKNAIGLSGNSNKTSYSIQASTLTTDGFNARQGKNPDNDGYNQKSANLFLKHKFNNVAEIELTALHSNNKNDFDNSTTANEYTEGLQETLGLNGVFNASKDWLITLRANQSKDYSDTIKDHVKSSTFNTKRIITSLQNELAINEYNLMTIGIENKDTSITGTSSFTKSSRNNKAIYIQNNWNKNNNNLLLSIRSDDNESFGKHTTGNVSWGRKLKGDSTLVLSAANAYKAPSFNDLYYPLDAWGYAGNLNILPETSESFEILLKNKNTQMSVYRTNIENLISWSGLTSPINIGSSKILGVELSTSFNIADWRTQVNLSVIDPINNSTGELLPKRSRETLRFDFDKTFSNYSLGATVKAQGERFISTSTQLDSYVLIDFRAAYKLNKNWSIKGKITNVVDADYTVNDGYNTPERSFYISVSYQGL